MQVSSAAAPRLAEHYSKASANLWGQAEDLVEYEPYSNVDEHEFLHVGVEFSAKTTANSINAPKHFSDALRGNDGVPPLQKSEIGSVIGIFWVWRDDNSPANSAAIFQCTDKQNHIEPGKILYLRDNVFDFSEGRGLAIKHWCHSYYKGNRLYFRNDYFPRRIFDFQACVAPATTEEIDQFFNNESLFLKGGALPKSHLLARKVAYIKAMGTLNGRKAEDIAKKAKLIGIVLEVDKGRIRVPEEPKALRAFISFLAEDIYTSWNDKNFKAAGKRPHKS